jgi:hypothetical protein
LWFFFPFAAAMAYYVGENADATADAVRNAAGTINKTANPKDTNTVKNHWG